MSGTLPAGFNIAEHFVEKPAQRYPDRAAILGEPAEVSYRALNVAVNEAGNAFASLGCKPGDRVLVVLPDSVEFVAAFFGASKIGAIAVPVNPFTRRGDYGHYISDSQPSICVVHQESLPEFIAGAEMASAARSIRAVIVVGKFEEFPVGESSALRLTYWNTVLVDHAMELSAFPTKPADLAFILYTSGSGGNPKGAVHRHEDMLYTTAGFATGILDLQAEDRTFSVSKLFFAYGLGNGMYFPFSVGASTILNPDRPRPEKIAQLLSKYRPTVFFSVPTFYAQLLQQADRGLALDFASVRIAVSAGEALPPEVLARFRERFGLKILDGIGSTEMLHMFIASRPGLVKPGSCGKEVEGFSAKIVGDTGMEVSQGEIGNLWVKGKSAFAGYWQKPELTNVTLCGDWVITGDKFRQDSDGYFIYCGRGDDMLKVAGMWVSPVEVENALLGHPAVAEAAVVGLCGDNGLVRIVAHVVLREGVRPGLELRSEIGDFLRGRLPSYKIPQEFQVCSELPKTATGKIQRFRLREPTQNSSPT